MSKQNERYEGELVDRARRIGFSDLVESDLNRVVVIYTEILDDEDNKIHYTAEYTSHGYYWKRIGRPYLSRSSIITAREKSTELNCRFVDDSATRVYNGDWDGHLIPEHLINLEVLAKEALRKYGLRKRTEVKRITA